MANTDPLLSPPEFRAKQHNFFMLFGQKGSIADMLRAQPFYQRCLEKNKRFKKLQDKLMQLNQATADQDSWPESFWKLLYDAYRMMHPYADKDSQLFL